MTDNLRYKYVKRGVVRTSEDGLDGIVDWLESTDSYIADGLKKMIQDAVLTIKDGTDLTVFIDTCVNIVEHGKY